MKRIALAAAVVLALLPAVAHGAFSGRNGDLVYGWSQLDEPDLGPFHYVEAIRLISPRGGEPRTVVGCEQTLPATAAPAARTCVLETFADPAVSRDRARIAFDDGSSLALVDRDGSDLRVLPAQSADDGEPAFSAAGGRLAFSAGVLSTGSGGDSRAIWIRDIARGTTRRVVGGTDPAWSSRNWIAFESNDTEQIWMVRPGGRGLRRLTRSGAEPTWSPHGTKLAFVRGHSILVLDLRTHRSRRVARGVDATDLAWSPDGRRLAYTLFDGGVETIGVDGRRPRALVAGGVGGTYNLQAVGLDWQPRR